MGWVFTLGIIVGKGLLPVGEVGPPVIKGEIQKDDHKLSLPIKEEELAFYKELVEKKERARRETVLTPQEKSREHKMHLASKIDEIKREIGNYSVQVAALKDRDQAEGMVERLTRLGYPAYFYKGKINGEIYYRIRCGPFLNMEEARKYAHKLAAEQGFKPFISQKD